MEVINAEHIMHILTYEHNDGTTIRIYIINTAITSKS